MLDTDQLRSFLAIVDTGSFTKAAERVNKTQSAVSMHVRRLEEQLACALFVKHGRGAKLSPQGEKLIDFARKIVQVEAGAVAALSRKGLKGSVRVGIPDDYAEVFLADIVTHFRQRHPMVEMTVVCEGSPELAVQVREAALDIALITDFEGMHGVEIIREEPLVFVASKRFEVSDDAPLPLALGSVKCLWRKIAEEALCTSNLATRGLFFSKNYSAISSVVRAGLAATVLPVGMAGPDMRVLGAEHGLPQLPLSRMGLVMAPGLASEEANALADAIRATVSPLKQAA
jgi:DNA-binding transcriptional LysR family regulator